MNPLDIRAKLIRVAADLDPEQGSEYLRGMIELIVNATATDMDHRHDRLGTNELHHTVEHDILQAQTKHTEPKGNIMTDSTWYDDTIDMGDYGYALLSTTDEGDHSLNFTDYLESALDVFDGEDEKNVLFDEDGWLNPEVESIILEYVRGILPDHYDVAVEHYGGDDPHITFDVYYKGDTTPNTVYDDYYPAYAILHNATDDYRIYRYALTALGV